jgi:type I restriction enzyme R subunit
MPLNEAVTRVRLIEPRLAAAGWTGTQVTREHYYHRDRAYTAGRIYLRGTQARRDTPCRKVIIGVVQALDFTKGK